MSKLTNTILEALLAGANDPSGLESALREHADSKGPFYIALARATASLSDRYRSLVKDIESAHEKLQESRELVQASDGELSEIKKQVEAKDRQMIALEKRLEDKGELLSHARALADLGFGSGELSTLRDILSEAVASGESGRGDAIPNFFSEVKCYQDLLALRAQASEAEATIGKAKAEVRRWQAEAEAAEGRCSARRVSIELAEKLASEGVEADDLPCWTGILAKAGVSPRGMGKALGRYASLKALIKDRQKSVNELERQERALQSEVDSLSQHRETLEAGINAVRDESLAGIERAGQEVVQLVRGLAGAIAEYADLKEQRGKLDADITVARALQADNPEEWKGIKKEKVMMLAGALITWAWANDFNPLVEPPATIQGVSLLTSFNRVPFVDLLKWVAVGLTTGEGQLLATNSLHNSRA